MESVKRKRRWPGRVLLLLIGWTSGVWTENRISRVAEKPASLANAEIRLIRLENGQDYTDARVSILERKLRELGHDVWMVRRGK